MSSDLTINPNVSTEIIAATKIPEAETSVAKTAPETAARFEAPEQVGLEVVSEVIDALNALAQAQQRDLQFSVDKPTGRTVIRVYDSTSEELVRQIPVEEVLSLAQRFVQGDTGALMNIVA